MKLSLALPATILAITAAGCSSTSTPQFQSGEDADMTHDGLTRVDRTVMDAVWAREDADVSGYTKIKFRDVGVVYRNVSGPYSGRAGTGSIRRTTNARDEFKLDADTRALFEEVIKSAFVEELGRSTVFELVDEPGPDVLLVTIGLLDVVSRVPPEAVGRSRILIESVG